MTLRIFPVPGKAKSDMICKAFLAGAPKTAVGSVFFGTEGQMTAFERAKACGEPWYYIDNSYFDKHRGIYFRVTKSALQVDPRGRTSDGSRFKTLNVKVKERTNTRGRIVLVPQSEQFMKSTGYVGDWVQSTLRNPAMSAALAVHVHPWQRDKIARGEAFAEMLGTTRLVITYSSAAAITALLEGVPAISTSDTAAAHRIGGSFTREFVDVPTIASVEERRQFAEVLADSQFSMDEFRSGKAWAILNR